MVGSIEDAQEVLLAIHGIVREFLERGDVEVLLQGVSIDAVALRLGVSRHRVAELVRVLEEEGWVIVYKDSNGGIEYVKPIQLEALRFILEVLPYIDAKLVVVPRRKLKTLSIPSLDRLVRGLGLSRFELMFLARVWSELKGFAKWLDNPYIYQVDTWSIILEKALLLIDGKAESSKPIVISAGTGEGKTEAFFLPILLAIAIARLRGRRARAVILYPRKALAEEQLNRFVRYVYAVNKVLEEIGIEPIKIGILDGDTPLSWIHVAGIPRDRVEIARNIRCPKTDEKLYLEPLEAMKLVRRDLEYILRIARENRLNELYLERLEVLKSNLINITSGISTVPRFVCSDTYIDWILYTKTDHVFEKPDILITNFESLSSKLMDSSFSELWRDTLFLVVDEAHELYGLRGIHGVLIVRRLISRIELELGRKPLIIISSATIADPVGIARALAPWSEGIELISSYEDRYREEKPYEYVYHLFLVPSERITHETATTHVAVYLGLALKHHKVLVFTNSRSDAERIARYVVDKSSELESKRRRGSLEFDIVADPRECRDRPCLASREAVGYISRNGMKLEAEFHHAGLKKDERARVEERFRESKINILASTSTLELGIDIGDVDAVVLHGVPPTLASYHQRAGRGGARGREAIHPVVVTVIDLNSPRDIHAFAHAEDIVDRRYIEEREKVSIYPEHNIVALAQQALAAVLDYIAFRGGIGASLSPSTLASLQLNPSSALDVIDREINKAIEYGLKATTSSYRSVDSYGFLENALYNSLRVLRHILQLLEQNRDLLELIKLSAIKVWGGSLGGIDLKSFSEKVSRDIESMLQKVFESLGLVNTSRLEQFLDVIRRAPRAIDREKLGDLDKVLQILVYEACIRLLHEIVSPKASMSIRRLEEELDIAYTNVLKILENVVLLSSEFVSAIASVGLGELLKNLNLVNVVIVVGKRSSIDIDIVDENDEPRATESLLDAYIHYPPGHHVIRGNIVYEAQYLQATIRRIELPSCRYVDYSYRTRVIDGVAYPEKIVLSYIYAGMLNDKKSKGRGYRWSNERVLAFGWTDPSSREYIDPRDYRDLPEEYRKKLRSIDIVFVCPTCLRSYISSWFSIGKNLRPYYYPMGVRSGRHYLLSLARYPAIIRHGVACTWYPYLEDDPSKADIQSLVCPNKRCRIVGRALKACTPIRVIPIVVDRALDSVSIDRVSIGRISIGKEVLSILYAIDKLLFFLDRIPYTVNFVYRSGPREYVLGYVFKTNGISIALSMGSELDISSLWSVRSVRWKYLYHRVIRKLIDFLESTKDRRFIESDVDIHYIADKIIALLRLITIAIKLNHKIGSTELSYICRAVLGANIVKNKIAYDYSFKMLFYSFLRVLSEKLKEYSIDVLDVDALDKVLSKNVKEQSIKLLRYPDLESLLEAIARDYIDVVLRGAIVDRDDVLEFLRYTAMHSFLHIVAKYVATNANVSIYEVKTSCSVPSGETMPMVIYELCEGGSGILWSFYEHLKKDRESVFGKIIGFASRCPREVYGYELDAILGIDGIEEVVEFGRRGDIRGIARVFRKRLGSEMSFGLRLRIQRLLNSYEDLVAVLMFRKLVEILRDALGMDPLPYEIEYVIKYVSVVFNAIANDRVFVEKLKTVAKLYGKEFDFVKAKEYLYEFLAKPTIEVERDSEEREIELKRIAIVLEEYACRDTDGCWICLSLPYCIHVRSTRSLLPYLSKSCLKLLA